MSINIADVITEWGAQYRAGGQSQKDLINMFYQGDETSKILSLIPTNKTILEKSSADISSVLQPYQNAFTPAGDTTFKPHKIQLFKQKIDIEEVPDDIEQSWLGFLASNNLSRKEWPFIKFWIETLIMKKEIEDFEEHAVFGGVRVEPTAGVASTPDKAINGLKKVINDHISAGDTTTIATGAIETDPVLFVDQVEDYYEQIPVLYRKHVRSINCSDTLFRRFKKGMREKYNMSYDMAEITKVIDTKAAVVGLASHAGSNKIWSTIPSNAVLGVKKPGNPGTFKVEESKRMVSILTDYYKGVGVWIPKWLFPNDQDLV